MFRINLYSYLKEKTCLVCGRKSKLISTAINVCLDCLRERPEDSEPYIFEAHKFSRGQYGLPPEPPRSGGLKCKFCSNECELEDGMIGFCGLTVNIGGRLKRLGGTPKIGIVDYYYDPLPTNCVAGWICPGNTGRGYPKYSYNPKGEVGYYNLAVFYGSCSLDCLFCQNWVYRRMCRELGPKLSAGELAGKVYERVSCVCYFGGDPASQMPHAIAASKLMVERSKGRILRICWETNGLMNPAHLESAVQLSLDSGGILKFDFKAWTPTVYKALTGCDNRPLKENLKKAVKRFDERPEVPLVTVSTLLVPGYVDVEEVHAIASYLADLNVEIPYSLLVFHPDYQMNDLPPTSRRHVEECVSAAKKAGLVNVHVGNVWLIGEYY